MKIQNTSIYIGKNQTGTGTLMSAAGEAVGQKEKTGKSIYAGDLNNLCDTVEQKRQQARKQAMRIVGDVWESEQKIDADLAARSKKIEELYREVGTYNQEINAREAERAKLKEAYGVAEDSREQQELDLLEKEADSRVPGKGVHLTKEEREQIEKIKADGLTEYQSRMLEKKEICVGNEIAIEELEKEIELENAIITGIKLERLKSNPMGKAQRQADAIMNAASEEIVGMLVDEAKEHLDKEMQEKVEQAERKEEKEEIREEKLEKIKEKKEEQEELTEEIIEATEELISLGGKQIDVQKEIKNIMNKMKILEDDIKGAKVDEEV